MGTFETLRLPFLWNLVGLIMVKKGRPQQFPFFFIFMLYVKNEYNKHPLFAPFFYFLMGPTVKKNFLH